MTRLVDIVNFNADASCLHTSRWLSALEGGTASEFYRWLMLYVGMQRKVVLGLTGATIADIAVHNPEACALLKDHPDLFQAVIRPFSHDIALMRAQKGFKLNLDFGVRAITSTFSNVSKFYLPPEFMLSNDQLSILAEEGFDGVFVNSYRLTSDIRARVPSEPYRVKGVGGRELGCVPVAGQLTEMYLNSLHCFSARPWNDALLEVTSPIAISWRDGESSFLLPDGLEREAIWLRGECISRVHLTEIQLQYKDNIELQSEHLCSYPVHSFLAWMREFRMMGYLNRLQALEANNQHFDLSEVTLWLQAINSDVLSAVEKPSPEIMLAKAPGGELLPHILYRAERGFEGEECLYFLERYLAGAEESVEAFLQAPGALSRKLSGRRQYLSCMGVSRT